MKRLKKEIIVFLRLSTAMILVPAIVAGVIIVLISIVTAVFSTPDWGLIGGIFWIFYVISFLLFGTFLHVQMEDLTEIDQEASNN